MKRLMLLLAVLAGLASLADTPLRNGGTPIGPVRDLDCRADGGLLCWRDAGSIGELQCAAASATATGCVTLSAQTFTGTKTLTSDFRLVGHVHGSLTACAAGTKGMWQTCTTHNSAVFCDGTTNIESYGGSAAESPLIVIGVNGIPAPFFAGFTLSSTTSHTITSLVGFWGTGTGVGSSALLFISAAGTCTCSIDCDNPGARTACSGNCTIAAGDTVEGLHGTSTCTLEPYVGNTLTVMGTTP